MYNTGRIYFYKDMGDFQTNILDRIFDYLCPHQIEPLGFVFWCLSDCLHFWGPFAKILLQCHTTVRIAQVNVCRHLVLYLSPYKHKCKCILLNLLYKKLTFFIQCRDKVTTAMAATELGENRKISGKREPPRRERQKPIY